MATAGNKPNRDWLIAGGLPLPRGLARLWLASIYEKNLDRLFVGSTAISSIGRGK